MTCRDVVERGPRDWVQIPWKIPADWRVADIGPGSYPLPRADVFIDHDPSTLNRVFRDDHMTAAEFHCAAIENGFEMIPDKHFDYVWASHILEHLPNPTAAAKVLSRIGKRGTLVVPSALKEALFHFEERDHRWLCLPSSQGKGPIFIAYHEPMIKAMRDIDAMKATCRLYRTGYAAHDCYDGDVLRRWFFDAEPELDVVYHWTDKLEIMVIA